jgi:prophage antirepressor-like protein
MDKDDKDECMPTNDDCLDMVFAGCHHLRIVGVQTVKPSWIAKDVCEVLGLSDTAVALRGLDEDEKGKCIVPTPGGPQEMLVISESGLYALIFRSRKQKAKAFRKWVTSEVLPEIRRHGAYGMHKLVQTMMDQNQQLMARQEEDRKFWLARDTETNTKLNLWIAQTASLREEIKAVREPKAIGREAGRQIKRRLMDVAWDRLRALPEFDNASRTERKAKRLALRREAEDTLRRDIAFPRDTGNSFERLSSHKLGDLQGALNTLEAEARHQRERREKSDRKASQQDLFSGDASKKPN